MYRYQQVSFVQVNVLQIVTVYIPQTEKGFELQCHEAPVDYDNIQDKTVK
jgi:hypothetical protein